MDPREGAWVAADGLAGVLRAGWWVARLGGRADAGLWWRAGGALRAGERERGLVGGVEGLEVREALGQAHGDPAGGAHDPSRDAEQDPPQGLGVSAQRRVLVGRVAGGAGGGADVAHPGADVQRQ